MFYASQHKFGLPNIQSGAYNELAGWDGEQIPAVVFSWHIF